MRKRQLPFPKDTRDPRNNLQPDTEVAVRNHQGGTDAVDTACISKIEISTTALIQIKNIWGEEASGTWRAGAGPAWKNLRYVTAYFCSGTVLEHSHSHLTHSGWMGIGDEDCLHLGAASWKQLKILSLRVCWLTFRGTRLGRRGADTWPRQAGHFSISTSVAAFVFRLEWDRGQRLRDAGGRGVDSPGRAVATYAF